MRDALESVWLGWLLSDLTDIIDGWQMCTRYGLDCVNHLLQNLFCFGPCINHAVFWCSLFRITAAVCCVQLQHVNLSMGQQTPHNDSRRHYPLNVAWDYGNLYTVQSGKMFKSLIHSFGRERCDLWSELNKFWFVWCLTGGEKHSVVQFVKFGAFSLSYSFYVSV